MLDYLLTEEQQMIRDLARKVAIEKVLPKRAEWDETGEFPHEAMKAFSEADLCGLNIPEELGGVGVTFAASALGSTPILLFGTDEQKKKYMPPIAMADRNKGARGATAFIVDKGLPAGRHKV
jgi:butyryl-CoA dehydrogenase